MEDNREPLDYEMDDWAADEEALIPMYMMWGWFI